MCDIAPLLEESDSIADGKYVPVSDVVIISTNNAAVCIAINRVILAFKSIFCMKTEH